MPLALPELIKLAILTKLMDGPTSLPNLLGASEMWHELKGRVDLRLQLTIALREMLESDMLTVIENHADGPESLTGVDAQMAIERAANGLSPTGSEATVEISTTPRAEESYRTLANGYYNG